MHYKKVDLSQFNIDDNYKNMLSTYQNQYLQLLNGDDLANEKSENGTVKAKVNKLTNIIADFLFEPKYAPMDLVKRKSN